MRIFSLKTTLVSLITLLIVSACTGPSSKPSNPTATLIPTSAPTATLTPVPAPRLLGEYELLSPEDMRYDLDELFHRIETTHPNPYSKRSKTEVDLERQRIYDELSQPMTMIEFYRKVAPLVNSLEDPHTHVGLPEGIAGELYKKELFFPFVLQVEKVHIYIVYNFSNNSDIETYAELLEVNGMSAAEILKEGKRYYPLGSYIHPFALLSIFGSLPEYEMDVILPGETTSVMFTAPGMASEQIERKASTDPSLAAQSNELMTYQTFPKEKVGLLSLNGFVGIGPLLKPAFVQFQEENVQHLILDIRANPGGKYDDTKSLMNYIMSQPYRWCSRSYEAPFGGYGTGEIREVECDLVQPFEPAERFNGKLYVLIGADTFSAAITFATVLQDMGLATLIGEQTTDTASYCANVVLEGTKLPRTDLTYWCSKTCYVRPSGVLDDRGVIPDMIVETTIQDRLTGKDPVLEYTLDLIRNAE